MTTTNTPALSAFALFAQGDIKGGTAAHAYRLSQVRLAIEQALKGNATPITEALAQTMGKDGKPGKAKKARAYSAGFAAVGSVDRVPYVGALSAPVNSGVKAAIEDTARHLTTTFDEAFRAVADAAPVARPAKVEAPAATSAASDGAGDAQDSADTSAPTSTAADLRAAAVLTVLSMIQQGMLLPTQLEALDDALANAAAPVAVEAEELESDVVIVADELVYPTLTYPMDDGAVQAMNNARMAGHSLPVYAPLALTH